MHEYALIKAGYTVDHVASRRVTRSPVIIVLLTISIAALATGFLAAFAERKDVALVAAGLFVVAAVAAILIQHRLARCGGCGQAMRKRILEIEPRPNRRRVVMRAGQTHIFVCEDCKRFFVYSRVSPNNRAD